MVSRAATESFWHRVGLFVALLVTLTTDALAIAYVAETRKKCARPRQQNRADQTDLGWTLVGLAAADILLATIICVMVGHTHFL